MAAEENPKSRAKEAVLNTPAARRVYSDSVRLAVATVLRDRGNPWMLSSEIASESNRLNLCPRRDGGRVSVQLVGRLTRNYAGLFERKGGMVRLRSPHLGS
jgi:hypothetical protein